MKSSATTSQARRTPPPQRTVRRGIVLAAAAVILGLGAMFGWGALRRPVHDGGELGEVSRERDPSPTEQGRAARPALPPALPAEPAQPALADPAPARRHLPASIARQLTENKVQQYAHVAYPAWRRAHPGQDCPQRLIELNAYMDDKADSTATDARDAWGRQLKMICIATRPAGAKRFKVISLGRDAERNTEDDVTAEE